MAGHKSKDGSDTVLTWKDILLAALLALLLTALAQLLTTKHSAETNSYHNDSDRTGFTLIEMSIVLVVIGLITGGVLVGQDLVRAAEVRAQISQIEKFNTATNTFYGKFQTLPGDMNYSTAAAFGFNTGPTSNATTGCGGRTPGAGAGQGNGDGLLDGYYGAPTPYIFEEGCFWVDLGSQVAGSLVEGSFASAAFSGTCISIPYTVISKYLPAAKVGKGNFIYVLEAGGLNYYGLSNVSNASSCTGTSNASLSPLQAYNIDKKVDDGYPNSGNVIAYYVGTSAPVPSTPNGTAAAAGNCYDATGVTGFLQGSAGVYNTSINGGSGTGCGLMFKFQ